MSNNLKILFSIAAIAILGYILYTTSCNSVTEPQKNTVTVKGKTYTIIKHTTDTIKDTVTQIKYVAGNTLYRDYPVYISVPKIVDTTEILKKYFSLQVYKDTLKLTDSLGFVAVIDSVLKNQIISRQWTSNIFKTIIKDTLFLEELKNEFYFGPTVVVQTPNSLGLGAMASLKTKKNQIISLSVGVNSTLQPFLQGTIVWKIRSIKK